MQIDTIIAELKATFNKYDALGLIDDMSIYKWSKDAMNKFGALATIRKETVLSFHNHMAKMPDDYFGLIHAYKCEPVGYHMEDEERHKAVLQRELGWKERSIHGYKWNSCSECCKEEYEQIVVEKVFMLQPDYNEKVEIDFYYKNPIMLKIGETFKQERCYDRCRNKNITQSPYVLNINGRHFYSSFDGFVYMKYLAILEEENGLPIIPETTLGYVQRYVEAYLTTKILERILYNSDDPNVTTKLQYARSELAGLLPQAISELKNEQMGPEIFEKMRLRNRERMMVYEMMWPGR